MRRARRTVFVALVAAGTGGRRLCGDEHLNHPLRTTEAGKVAANGGTLYLFTAEKDMKSRATDSARRRDLRDLSVASRGRPPSVSERLDGHLASPRHRRRHGSGVPTGRFAVLATSARSTSSVNLTSSRSELHR